MQEHYNPMRWPRGTRLAAVIATATIAGCWGMPPQVSDPPQMPVQTSRVEVAEASVESVARDLEVVWGLGFAPDGRLFVSERPGRVRVIDPAAGLREEAWAELDVWASGEAGLLGLALHPQFADTPFVYVMYTYRDHSGGSFGRVSRLTELNGRGIDETVVLDGIPAASRHCGGALSFGPDGMLYIGTGDATRPGVAQDEESLGGKILRVRSDGSIPEDNPFPGSPVFALGLRNVQGFDWDPATGRMFATMHGPTGEWGRFGRDEINVIQAGGNYGWPKVLGAPADPRFVDPLLEYSPAVAPANALFYDGPIDAWRGDLFFATLRGEHLHRVRLAEGQPAVLALERLWPDAYGRIRALARGPDGHLYFATSNRDGRGQPRPGDDQVYRIVPASPSGG